MENLYTPAEYFMFVEKFDHYFPRKDPYRSLLSEFNYRLENLVVFHRFVINTYANNKKAIDVQYNKFNFLDNEQKKSLSDDEHEIYELSYVRHMEYINHQTDLNEKASYIANDSVAINLWAMNEQFMTRGLANLISQKENKELNDVKTPYKWDTIKSKFLSYGINFETLPSYDDINECRTLNNKIKHLNLVDSGLEVFPPFKGKLNESLTGMAFPLQKYIIGSHHFIGMLLEECSQK